MQKPYYKVCRIFEFTILIICSLFVLNTILVANPPPPHEDKNLLAFLKNLQKEEVFFLETSNRCHDTLPPESQDAMQTRYLRFLEFVAGKKYTFCDGNRFFVDDALICYFLENHPKKILILRNCSHMTPAMLQAAGECCEQIQELHIQAGFDLGKRIYPALKNSFKQLQRLNLEKFDGPTNEAEMEALSTLRLRQLRMLSCKYVNDIFLEKILKNNTLEALTLECLLSLTGTAFRELSALKLSHVALIGCPSLNPNVISWVLWSCFELEQLDIQRNGIYIESIFSSFFEKQRIVYPSYSMPRLQVLSLAYSPHISKENLKTIAEKIPSLTALNLSGLESVTPWLLDYFSKNLLSLKILNLRDCSHLNALHMAALANVATLEELDLSGCEHIDVTQLPALLRSCPITQLSLGRSLRFSKETVFVLMACLSNDFKNNKIKLKSLFIIYPNNCFNQFKTNIKTDHCILQKYINFNLKKLNITLCIEKCKN